MIFRELSKLVKDSLTLSDGLTYCMGRIYAGLSSITGMFLAVWDVLVQHAHFDLTQFGVGVGSMAVGIGALLKIKASTEPDAPRPASFVSEKVSTPGESVSVTTATAAGGHQ